MTDDMKQISVDFKKSFGKYLISSNRNSFSLNLQVHHDLRHINLCFNELFQSLNSDLSMFFPHPINLRVWKVDSSDQFYCANELVKYYYLKNSPQKVDLRVFKYPNCIEKVQLLKKISSLDFLNSLEQFSYDLKKLNPIKLQRFINQYICPEQLLSINKEQNLKPRPKIGLDTLAKKLKVTRNQLNYRIEEIDKARLNALNQLEENSSIIEETLNQSSYYVSPDKVWR